MLYEWWTAEVARRSDPGYPGCLLHPATRRATGVRWWAARFRAWPGVAGEPRRTAPSSGRHGPLSPADEASTLALGARAGLTGRARCSVPAEDCLTGDERGLTARP